VLCLRVCLCVCMCKRERVTRCQNVFLARLAALIKGRCVHVCELVCLHVCGRESDTMPECISNSPTSADYRVLCACVCMCVCMCVCERE